MTQHEISPLELGQVGRKIRIAHFYELALILNRIILKNIPIKLIFVDNQYCNLWTISLNSMKKIQMVENETIENVPLFSFIGEYSLQSMTNGNTHSIEDELIKEIIHKKRNIIILHLSDIHVNTNSEARKYRTSLETDLIKELKVNRLDYVVISGDIANNSTEEEYEAAIEIINNLSERFKLDSNRFILVPGNHDLNWNLSANAYSLVSTKSIDQFTDKKYIPAGSAGVALCNEYEHKQRFANFSKFYKTVCGQEYPLEYAEQNIIYENPDDKILFLGLNSCWEVDHSESHKERYSINMDSLSNSIDQLNKNKYDNWLKIAVWHNPVSGSESMKDVDFLEQLIVNGFQICMHGHIHEAIGGYHEYDDKRNIKIIGAGTFGAPIRHEKSGIPLQYNLLIYNPVNNKITVNSRKKEKVNGAWSADARWGDKNSPKSSYLIDLNQ